MTICICVPYIFRSSEFANGAAQSGILTLEETNEIFLYYTAQKKPSLTFPVVKRQGLLPLCCHRFQSSAYRSNQWRYRLTNDYDSFGPSSFQFVYFRFPCHIPPFMYFPASSFHFVSCLASPFIVVTTLFAFNSCRGRCDAIQFAVDRRIFIAGFGLYGSSNGAAEYMVSSH